MTDVKRINKQATATMLFVIADAITQPRFVKFLEDNTSRFGSDGTGTVEELHDKLRLDFDFQLKQALSVYSEQYTILSWGEKFQMMSEQLTELADRVSLTWRVNLHKTSKKFIVPRGVSLESALTNLLLGSEPHRLVLAGAQNPTHPDYDWRWGRFISDASHFICHFYRFAVAKDTLTNETDSVFYEDVLSEFGNKIEWLIKGYPHDLLVNDRMSATKDLTKDYQGIALKLERCSTWSITEESLKFLPENGYRLLRRNTYGRTKQVAA